MRSRSTQAKAAGRTDLTFSDSCDTSTGRLKIPDFYAPECYANVDDNGGATATGVTADSITVVVYIAPDTDPVLDFITAAISNDDTGAQAKQTYQDYTDMINALYQTYGRKVELKFLDALRHLRECDSRARRRGQGGRGDGRVRGLGWPRRWRRRGPKRSRPAA